MMSAAIGEAFHVVVTQGVKGVTPLVPGAKIELDQSLPVVPEPGAQTTLAHMFSDGLSRHGKTYMTEYPGDPKARPGWAVDLFFEAVRRAEFRHCPSRMQSVFGFESIVDARTFIQTRRSGHPCAIYRVRGEVTHKANMSLLEMCGHSGAVAFDLARNYWLGRQGPTTALWELLLRPPVECLNLVEPLVQQVASFQLE